jgi:hypothetical protein
MSTNAELGVASLTEAMLIQVPNTAPVLQSNKVGDTVVVKVPANGITYEVTWKVTGSHKSIEPLSIPIANPTIIFFTSNTRCKFGRACIKCNSCPYSHTKFCTRLNATQGCTKGADCESAHELEGVKRTRSVTRKAFSN